MKKIITFSIIGLFILSGINILSTTGRSTCEPGISLPPDYITMIAEYGVTNYFDIALSNVPTGYDVSNGSYPGWCIQRSVWMDRGFLLSVVLYSSYDPALPIPLQDDDWDKVNYILNNKQGDRMDIQEAIWYFINDYPYTTDLAEKMVLDANENGTGFCPAPGEIIAVIVDNDGNVEHNAQRIIIEVNVPGQEGCSHGFYKKHIGDWVNYHPLDTVGGVFEIPEDLPHSEFISSQFLWLALYFKGGPDVYGAAKILLQQSVAAVLNAAHPEVNYPLNETEVIDSVNEALASLDRDTMLDLKDTLDDYNNLCSDLCCD